MRTLTGGFFFVVFGVGSLLMGLCLFPVLALCGARRTMRLLVRTSWRLFIGGASWAGLVGVDLSESDRARLASARGCVLVANHPTLIDVMMLMVNLPDATAIAKAAARGNFFYSFIVRGAFLVNDEPARTLAEASRLLGEGVTVVVFPQGTRTPVGTVGEPFHRGAAQIALHAGAPVLPVSVTCTPPILAKGQAWSDLGDRRAVWTLRVGEAIHPTRRDGQSVHAAARELTELIRARLASIPA